MDLKTVVTSLLTFLKRVIGKDVVLEVRTPPPDTSKPTDHEMRTADLPMASYLQKPYSPTHLGRRPRGVLDEVNKAQPTG